MANIIIICWVTKQEGEVLLKGKEEALIKAREVRLGVLQRIMIIKNKNKKFNVKCFSSEKNDHMAKDCWSKKKKLIESNVVTSSFIKKSKDD